MVEGPGCKIKGEKIRGKIKGQTVKNVGGNAVTKKHVGVEMSLDAGNLHRSSFQEIKPSKGINTSQFDVLVGRCLDDVQTLGKELFMYFGDLCLRVHFLMAGSFRVNDQQLDNDYGKLTETPSFQLDMSKDVLKFYKSAIEVRPADSCKTRYEELNDVDICSPKFNYRRATELVRGQSERQICDVLLDQTILPGVGNIIKNEALFDSGIKPSSKVKELSDDLVAHLVKMTRDFTMIFYKCRSTGTSLNKYLKIYKKGKCGQCQGKITTTRMGDDSERVTFYCPGCQTNTLKTSIQSLPTKNSLLGWIQQSKGEEWTCQSCTLINKGGNSVCEVCMSPRTSVSDSEKQDAHQTTKRKTDDQTELVNPSKRPRSGPSGSSFSSIGPSDKDHKQTETPPPGRAIGRNEQTRQTQPITRSSLIGQNSTNRNNPMQMTGRRGSNSAGTKTLESCDNSKIPLCTGHKLMCKIAQTRKEGNNYLRWFFTCSVTPRTKQCKFFKWADESFPICPGHGKPAAFRTVMKEGPNNGRKFFTCSLAKKKQCEFFEWAIGYDSLVL